YFRYETGGSAPSPLHLFPYGAKFITESDPILTIVLSTSGQMDARQQMKGALQLCIDTLREELFALSRDIWSRPELAGNETYAHDRLIRFFSQEDQAWTVQSHYKLPTAFRASWGPVGGGGGGEGDPPVLNVGFLCEYDALPGIGHACGHNLIAEVGAAAAVGLKNALQNNQTGLPVPVKITVLGTPAEEAIGGKIDLISEGAFADVDLVFMAHPAQQDVSFLPCVALDEVSVKYHGKASHAAAYPWEGVNALDAAVLAYNNISVLRQQLKPEWRLHGAEKAQLFTLRTAKTLAMTAVDVVCCPDLLRQVVDCRILYHRQEDKDKTDPEVNVHCLDVRDPRHGGVDPGDDGGHEALDLPETVEDVAIRINPEHDIISGGVVDEGALGVDEEHVRNPDLLHQATVEGHALVVGARERQPLVLPVVTQVSSL
ncbi:hypothetical protein INR49_019921, partial [Caranx melampygus]